MTKVVDQRMKTMNEKRVAPKQNGKAKSQAMAKVKILTIVFGIIVIGCFGPLGLLRLAQTRRASGISSGEPRFLH
jgi:hypothetical protein